MNSRPLTRQFNNLREDGLRVVSVKRLLCVGRVAPIAPAFSRTLRGKMVQHAFLSKAPHFSLIDPPNSPSVLPLSISLLTSTCNVLTYSVLLASIPVALKVPAVRPVEVAIAMLLIIPIGPFEPTTIRPVERSLSMHLILLPLPGILSLISPDVGSESLNVIFKLTFKAASIRPSELPFSHLDSINILPFVLTPVGPPLLANSMLLVMLPLSLVGRSVKVLVAALSVSLVI